MLVVRSTAKEIEDVKRAITSEFKMSDLGLVSQLLMLKITCDISADKMFLSQVPDVEKILECFGMQQAKGIDTLMVKQNTLVYANKRYQGDNSTMTFYHQAVSSLV